MKYKISSIANPDEFIKNWHIKIRPWIPNGKYCIKRAPADKDGFGEYISFPVEVKNFETVKVNDKMIPFADIYFDTEQYEWAANRVLIVDDKIWLEAIEGGIAWFSVKEVSE